MDAHQEMLTIDELRLNSFVTSLDDEEQLTIEGAGISPASLLVCGAVYDGLTALYEGVTGAIGEYTESMSNTPTTTETSPGFYDTSYPCG